MKPIRKFLQVLLCFSSFICACADPDLTAKVPRLENYESADGKLIFKAPDIPDWVSERTFKTVEVTEENKSTLLKTGTDLYKDKKLVEAYPYLLAASDNNQKVAHVYLGLILGQPGELSYLRGSIAHYYEALDSGAHASSFVVLARSLAAGEVIENDDAGAVQYYARLESVFPDKNSVLVKEARDFLKNVPKSAIKEAENREKAFLKSKGLEAKGGLKDLIKSTKVASGSSKAPGTEYLTLD